jgi:hypothetical protein
MALPFKFDLGILDINGDFHQQSAAAAWIFKKLPEIAVWHRDYLTHSLFPKTIRTASYKLYSY